MEPETYAESVFEAELAVPRATARLARFSVERPTDRVFQREDRYWLDMCLTPRPEKARGCYHDRWGPHRYEPLGEIFLVPPGESLRLRAEGSARQLSIICEIESSAVQQWLPAGIEWTDRRLAAGLDIVHPHMRACLFRLAAEVRRPGTGSETLATCIAGQLAIEVARYCEAVAEGPVAGGLASWRLCLIDERLQQPGTVPPLEELAELCGLSVRQLTRGFRASRGCSIGGHVSALRIDLAKRRLDTDESIKAIAAALGFATASAFSCAFRRATGNTPRQFRARQLQRRRIHPGPKHES